MKKLCSALVALMMLPALYAERRTDRALEDVRRPIGDYLQYQTRVGDWLEFNNNPEDGYAAGTATPGTEQALIVDCQPNKFIVVRLWWKGMNSLGTDYDDRDEQPVTLNWLDPDLTQSQEWIHLQSSDEDLDQVLIVDQLEGSPIKPREIDNFLDRLTRHDELNVVVTVSKSGKTKQATFSLDGAPSAETVKNCGQEGTTDPKPKPSETTLYFPDYVDGDGWSVQLAISNISATEAASVTVDTYSPKGQAVLDLFDSELSFEVPPLGSRILKSDGAGDIRRGWIEVHADTASVNGLLTYRAGQTGIEVGVEPVELGSHFALFVEETRDIGTGLAIFKPDESGRVEFRVRDETGSDPRRGRYVYWGFRNISQRGLTIQEWYDVEGGDTGFLSDFRGLLFLRTSDGSLFAPLGLRFRKGGGSLSAVPLIRVPQGDGP